MAFSPYQTPCTPSLSFPRFSKSIKFSNHQLLSSEMKSQSGSGFGLMIPLSLGDSQDHSTNGDHKADDNHDDGFHIRNRAVLPSDNQLLIRLATSSGNFFNHLMLFKFSPSFLLIPLEEFSEMHNYIFFRGWAYNYA